MVKRTAGPVLAAHGYSLEESGPHSVVYRASDRYFEFQLGDRDSEVAGYFGRADRNERLSLLLFFRAVAPELARDLSPAIAWDWREVEPLLQQMARGLESVGDPILDGNGSTYDWMTGVRWWHF